MTSLRPWLAPTLLGPLLLTWGFALFGALTIGAAALSLGFVDDFAVLVLWATFFGSTMGVFLVGADVALLALKWRSLPTGPAAWISSMVAPVICYGAWVLLPPPSAPLGLVAFLLAPMAGGALLSRMFFGSRP